MRNDPKIDDEMSDWNVEEQYIIIVNKKIKIFTLEASDNNNKALIVGSLQDLYENCRSNTKLIECCLKGDTEVQNHKTIRE